MPDPVFVDTNILIYAAMPGYAEHRSARDRLADYERAGVEVWLSHQILREFLSGLSRPSLGSPRSPSRGCSETFSGSGGSSGSPTTRRWSSTR